MENEKKRGVSASFKVGAVALAFLIIGYQSSLFIHKAALLRITANRDHPDTVYVAARAPMDNPGSGSISRDSPGGAYSDRPSVVGRSGSHSAAARRAYDASPSRRVESFRFNPNSASMDDFQRLGFSEKQAQSILNYRKKGGRFRRKSDFAKSYVVADSVYERLEAYIDIPMLDINAADSADFDALPGIGPYFASKMVSHRDELGGYSYAEQLMDIYHFDREKFDALSDLITVGPSDSLGLWSLDEKQLAKHPYIDKRAAHGIILYRTNSPRDSLKVGSLVSAGILSPDAGNRLSRCRILPPQ